MAVAGVVLVGTGWALRDEIVEQWYLWRLGSDSFVTKFQAARKLGAMRSTRAVPKLVALLKECQGHDDELREVAGSRVSPGGFMEAILIEVGSPIVPVLADALLEPRLRAPAYWLRYGCRALAKAGGVEAVPTLVTLLEDEWTCLRLVAIHELGLLGPEARLAVPALTRAAAEGRGTLPRVAASALERIQGPEGAAPAP